VLAPPGGLDGILQSSFKKDGERCLDSTLSNSIEVSQITVERESDFKKPKSKLASIEMVRDSKDAGFFATGNPVTQTDYQLEKIFHDPQTLIEHRNSSS